MLGCCIENGKTLVRNQHQQLLGRASQNRQKYVEFDVDFTKSNVGNKEDEFVKINVENNLNRKKSNNNDLVMAKEQLEQSDNVIRTRSGRIVKSTKNNQFVYY